MSLVATTEEFSCYALFVDGDDVFAGGYDGVLLRSGDGGASWTRLGFNRKHYSIHDVTRRAGGELLVACDGGRLVETGDVGDSWTTSQLSHIDAMNHVAVGRGLELAAGGHHLAWRRDGRAWREHDDEVGFGACAALVDVTGKGLVVSTHGPVVGVAAGAHKWRRLADLGHELNGAAYDANSGLVVVVGSAGFVAVSQDFGATFSTPPPATTEPLSAVVVRGATFFVGAGEGAVLRSDDGGGSWEAVVAAGSWPSWALRLAVRDDGGLVVGSQKGVFVDAGTAARTTTSTTPTQATVRTTKTKTTTKKRTMKKKKA